MSHVTCAMALERCRIFPSQSFCIGNASKSPDLHIHYCNLMLQYILQCRRSKAVLRAASSSPSSTSDSHCRHLALILARPSCFYVSYFSNRQLLHKSLSICKHLCYSTCLAFARSSEGSRMSSLRHPTPLAHIYMCIIVAPWSHGERRQVSSSVVPALMASTLSN